MIIKTDFPRYSGCQNPVGKGRSFRGCLQPGRLQSSPQGWVYGVPRKEHPFSTYSCWTLKVIWLKKEKSYLPSRYGIDSLLIAEYLRFIVEVLKTRQDNAVKRATPERIRASLVQEYPISWYRMISRNMVRNHSAVPMSRVNTTNWGTRRCLIKSDSGMIKDKSARMVISAR